MGAAAETSRVSPALVQQRILSEGSSKDLPAHPRTVRPTTPPPHARALGNAFHSTPPALKTHATGPPHALNRRIHSLARKATRLPPPPTLGNMGHGLRRFLFIRSGTVSCQTFRSHRPNLSWHGRRLSAFRQWMGASVFLPCH
ncbi:hypothetical protein CGRA01v4_14843 [Colletotrichum graminicola]|nr:hypothetical protein CGRA01v4_14843 [Colletotrichum graminicola]